MKRLAYYSILIIISLSLTSCSLYQGPAKSKKNHYQALSNEVSKLLGKVKGEILRGTKDSKQIKKNIQERYPNVLEPFADYYVEVANKEGTAFVLICNNTKTVKYIEDAKCTLTPDYTYEGAQEEPCSFSKKERYCSQ